MILDLCTLDYPALGRLEATVNLRVLFRARGECRRLSIMRAAEKGSHQKPPPQKKEDKKGKAIWTIILNQIKL